MNYFDHINTSKEIFGQEVTDHFNNFDLLDFPLNNLDHVDLSNDSFLANEIFPDDSLRYNNNNTSKNYENESIESTNIIKNEKEYAIYRDFSQVEDNQALLEINIEKQSNASSSVEKFPVKLHKIVERCETDGYSDIISWMPHGRSFKIHKRDAFVAQIMPRYFYITKFTSFIRQLTLYGFHKYRKAGADKGSFFHELFLCGRPALCTGIARSSEKKRKLESEPNFYKMPYMARIESNITGSFVSVPDRPRKVQYHNEVDTCLSRSNKIQKSSSFEYFHKSQQFVAKSLFSIYDQEEKGIKSTLPKSEKDDEYTAMYSCAA